MLVRLALDGDREAIHGLLRGVHGAFGEDLPPRVAVDRFLDQSLAGAGSLDFLVAIEGLDPRSEPIGLISIAFCPTALAAGGFAWIDDLFVVPAARRRGVGAALLRAAVAHSCTRGAVEIRLAAAMGDAALIRLHRGAGFLHHGQVLLVHDLSATKTSP